VPRPHKNLVVYHGVLAANARLRERAVAYDRPQEAAQPALRSEAHCAVGAPGADVAAGNARLAGTAPHRAAAGRGLWADLMRRAFGYDVLACPRCGAKLVLLACILDRATIGRILAHLGLPTESEHHGSSARLAGRRPLQPPRRLTRRTCSARCARHRSVRRMALPPEPDLGYLDARCPATLRARGLRRTQVMTTGLEIAPGDDAVHGDYALSAS
jgi:hypothetical protein